MLRYENLKIKFKYFYIIQFGLNANSIEHFEFLDNNLLILICFAILTAAHKVHLHIHNRQDFIRCNSKCNLLYVPKENPE